MLLSCGHNFKIVPLAEDICTDGCMLLCAGMSCGNACFLGPEGLALGWADAVDADGCLHTAHGYVAVRLGTHKFKGYTTLSTAAAAVMAIV